MPDQLSCGLVERMEDDRARGGSILTVLSMRRYAGVTATADAQQHLAPSPTCDTEKILHLPAYNRYNGKTQVFSFRSNDDLSRRGLHVQLVARIARDIGRALGLNCDLIEAIGLGRPQPYALRAYGGGVVERHQRGSGPAVRFFHNVHSVRVLDGLYGRNLSLQTLDGVLCHNGEYEQRVFELSTGEVI